MAINNILTLFDTIGENNKLRSSLNACTTTTELDKCLESYRLPFSEEEFEEAINLMHVKCQTQEQADELFSKVHWFRFLLSSLAVE